MPEYVNPNGAGVKQVFPFSVTASTNDMSAATGAGSTATVTAGAISQQPILAGIYWSYSGDPTGGRILVTSGDQVMFDMDVTKGGPGFFPFEPPIAMKGGTTASVQAVGAAGVTAKIKANWWRMQ